MVSVGIPRGAMEPLQAFCGSVDTPKSSEHIFQCLYQFLATTQSFWFEPLSYTYLDASHGVILIFFRPGSGMMISCPHNRQPSSTVISSLRVKYNYIVSWPVLSGQLYWTKVNTLDIIGSRQVYCFMLLAFTSYEFNRLSNQSISPGSGTCVENVLFNSILLRTSAFDMWHFFLYCTVNSYTDNVSAHLWIRP